MVAGNKFYEVCENFHFKLSRNIHRGEESKRVHGEKVLIKVNVLGITE